jgi:hypothetical protein
MPHQRSGRAKQTITKLAAAQRQLRTAARLFFEAGDEVSIHTLAAAARQLLYDLLRAARKKSPMQESFDLVIKPEGKKIFLQAMARAENFFKHADRDPRSDLDFNPEETQHILFECAVAYHALTGRHLRELYAVLLWYVLEYPQLLKPGAFKEGVAAALAEGTPHRDRRAFLAAFDRQVPASRTFD